MRDEHKGSSTQAQPFTDRPDPAPDQGPDQAPAPVPDSKPGQADGLPAHESGRSSRTSAAGQRSDSSTDQSPGISPGSPAGPDRPVGNAFSAEFLERVSRRDRGLRKEGKAPDERGLCAGPWEVEPVDGVRLGQPGHPAYAVVRRARPVAEGGGTVAVYGSYADALHTAAVLPALGCGNRLRLGAQRPAGVTVHDGRSFLGHVDGQGPAASPDLPLHLHVARHFAGNLDSLALLHRSLGWQALALLGRELMRRLA